MDEVWKEISLGSGSPQQQVPSSPSPSVHHHHYTTTTTTVGGIYLHDFFPGAFREVNQTPTSPLGGVSSFSSAGPEHTGKSLTEQKPDMRARRKLRMIKSKEAAARSRAREHAYKHELENEVNRLQNENRRLKSQREELLEEMASQNCMASNRTLQRSLTAPF